MNAQKIMVVEDEPDIREVIDYNLQREGFTVSCAADGEKALNIVQEEQPNLVLLDLMLPGLDGIEVCRQLKTEPETKSIPIIMVTAKGEESDIVLGLGVGADDYITKPFSPKELVARIKAVLRRRDLVTETKAADEIVRKGLKINANRFEVKIDGTPIEFTASEFKLLHFLATHTGRVFTRDQLLKHVVGEDSFVIDRNIDVHIRVIRKKLGSYRDLIKTIRGIGYRFEDCEGHA